MTSKKAKPKAQKDTEYLVIGNLIDQSVKNKDGQEICKILINKGTQNVPISDLCKKIGNLILELDSTNRSILVYLYSVLHPNIPINLINPDEMQNIGTFLTGLFIGKFLGKTGSNIIAQQDISQVIDEVTKDG